MWPWEHLAVGYLCYAAYARRRWRVAPAADATFALALATQLPDLIDKPLAWGLGVLPSGRSLAHSLLVAAPLTALAVALAARFGRRRVGVAFALAYASHLAGDVAYPLLTDGALRAGFLLWPLVPAPADPSGGVALLAHVRALLGDFRAFLDTPLGVAYLLFEVGLLGWALARWVGDGAPGFGALRSLVRA